MEPTDAVTTDSPEHLKRENYRGLHRADLAIDGISRLTKLTRDPTGKTLVEGFRKCGMCPVQQIQALQQAGAGGSMLGNIFGGQTTLGNVLGGIGGLGGQQPMQAQQYQVQAGDTLSQIAADNGISLDSLMANNPHITDPNMSVTVQRLTLAAGTTTVGAGGSGLSASAAALSGGGGEELGESWKVDWGGVDELWRTLFEKHLRIDPSCHDFIVTEPPDAHVNGTFPIQYASLSCHSFLGSPAKWTCSLAQVSVSWQNGCWKTSTSRAWRCDLRQSSAC